MSTLNVVAKPGEAQLEMARVFDAPRELVFKAYTDATLVPRWWGPRYLTTTVDKLEARSGGSWRFVQRAPDGGIHAFHGVYHDVTAPERLVYTFEYEGMPGHVMLETVVFEDMGGKTRVVVGGAFQSAADRDGMIESGMEEGAEESNQRLDELLAELKLN
ncbi:MAG: SRPBCC family protein [Anaerolineae bacterium]|uniref:SRPBCC family protein n=1 Tax=Promineifilum sp. TaxID=2664178 RepID=UPI001DC2BDDA|nr:SRPBCC family protein [Anaerolineales bacterium]MCB8934472.1 SRPBCC family protein [Promineifilum sp.]MCO5179958.1 SRPBCC family protein [Promineifilum sp.]MCW5847118.1 SRPBCC family protein [Anaerolineae bacterium]